jgi:predicted dithiol-disulfide oxidoreductase (DUF899 family)
MQGHPVVSREEWTAARLALMAREKELTRLQDTISAERRKLPWVRVDKPYLFDTLDGQKSLADLFDGRSQLFIYHFMFGPDWDVGCVGCSFFADHLDGANLHLSQHDLSVVAVSRAPLGKLQAYRERMGWRFPWVSSGGSDFNFDFNVSFRKEDLERGTAAYNFGTIAASMDENPGASVFFKADDGTVFHTYSAYARGDERSLGAYMFLDLTPNGRNETGPHYNLMDWVKRHDEYPASPSS